GSVSNMFAFQGPLVPTAWRPIVGNWNGSHLEDEEAGASQVGAAAEGESQWWDGLAGADHVTLDFAKTELGQLTLSAGAQDANVDGQISPLDVLTVINAINEAGSLATDSNAESRLYPDVNGDML